MCKLFHNVQIPTGRYFNHSAVSWKIVATVASLKIQRKCFQTPEEHFEEPYYVVKIWWLVSVGKVFTFLADKPKWAVNLSVSCNDFVNWCSYFTEVYKVRDRSYCVLMRIIWLLHSIQSQILIISGLKRKEPIYLRWDSFRTFINATAKILWRSCVFHAWCLVSL